MKKFVKFLALVVDLAFTPVRFVAGFMTLLCGCIVYEQNFWKEFKEMIKSNVYAFKVGFKPALDYIFKD